MNLRAYLPWSFFPFVAALAGPACSSSSTNPGTTGQDSGGGTTPPTGDSGGGGGGGGQDSGGGQGGGPDAGSGGGEAGTPGDSGAGATTTIAAARKANVTTAITVNAFVTALGGVPMDYPTWYIEDPAGGEYSGVSVYCDPLVTKACTVPEPALHDLIQVSGAMTTYQGQVQFIPTAMKVLQSNATFPPVAALTAADVAPTATSPYRGVFVSLVIGSELTVDSVTPSTLFDTECGTPPAADAGTDAAPPTCSPACEPPVYSGFEASDGTGNEVYVEAPFFNTDPLQSSPECLTQSGVVPVKVGTTFSKMSGVLDIDPYGMVQALSPVEPSDYASP